MTVPLWKIKFPSFVKMHDTQLFHYNHACTVIMESGWFRADHVFALGVFVRNTCLRRVGSPWVFSPWMYIYISRFLLYIYVCVCLCACVCKRELSYVKDVNEKL